MKTLFLKFGGPEKYVCMKLELFEDRSMVCTVYPALIIRASAREIMTINAFSAKHTDALLEFLR